MCTQTDNKKMDESKKEYLDVYMDTYVYIMVFYEKRSISYQQRKGGLFDSVSTIGKQFQRRFGKTMYGKK